jgi:hypothetical protein
MASLFSRLSFASAAAGGASRKLDIIEMHSRKSQS